MATTKLADKAVPSPSVTPFTAPSESTPAASVSLDGRLASLPPVSANTTHWNAQGLVTDRPEWAGAPPHDAPAETESHLLSQRLESIGQRPSMPSQRLESLAGDDQSRALLQRWPIIRRHLCWTPARVLIDGQRTAHEATAVAAALPLLLLGLRRTEAAADGRRLKVRRGCCREPDKHDVELERGFPGRAARAGLHQQRGHHAGRHAAGAAGCHGRLPSCHDPAAEHAAVPQPPALDAAHAGAHHVPSPASYCANLPLRAKQAVYGKLPCSLSGPRMTACR